MGDNPPFLFLSIYFILSQDVSYFCNNSFVSLFSCNVVPSKVSSRKLMLDLDFCTGTDFCCPPFWSVCTPEKSQNSEKIQAWSSDMYATFISFKFSDLSKLSASKKFVFTDCSVLTDSAFYFAFSLLLYLSGFLCSTKHQWL